MTKQLGSEFYINSNTLPQSVGCLIWGVMFASLFLCWGLIALLEKLGCPIWLIFTLFFILLLAGISIPAPLGFYLYESYKAKKCIQERRLEVDWKEVMQRFGWGLAKLNDDELNKMWNFFYPNSNLVRLNDTFQIVEKNNE